MGRSNKLCMYCTYVLLCWEQQYYYVEVLKCEAVLLKLRTYFSLPLLFLFLQQQSQSKLMVCGGQVVTGMHLLLAFIGNTVTFPIDPIQPAWEESNKNETRNVKVGMYVCILLCIKNRSCGQICIELRMMTLMMHFIHFLLLQIHKQCDFSTELNL